ALLAGTVASLPWLWKKRPAVAFRIAWFLAGHALEAGPLPLDLVYEHRNYLPSAGVFLGLTTAGALGLERLRRGKWLQPLVAAAVLSTLAILTSLRVYEWQNPLHWGIAQASHHPRSAISQLELGAAYATLAEKVDRDRKSTRLNSSHGY